MVAERPRSVEIKTFRRFHILLDGEPLHFSTKARRKPLELLKVLIALGADGVSAEHLADALWPDAPGDASQKNFTITLYRLRELIGRAAVLLRDRRLSLNPDVCAVDRVAFDQWVQQAGRARSAEDAPALSRAMGQILDLYAGPYLDGEYEPPEILTARDALHSTFIRCVEESGRWLCEQGKFEDAMRLFRRGLEIDNMAESFYRTLMRCHLVRGEVADGLEVYRRCRAALESLGGIQPAPDTLALAQELNAARIPADALEPSGEEPTVTLQHGTQVPANTAEREIPIEAPGERSLVTVLHGQFRDLPGVDEARLDPETVSEVHLQWERIVGSCVGSHGGIVNQFAAEGFVAVFGVPNSHEDDPVRAVHTALDLIAHHSAEPHSKTATSAIPLMRFGVDTGTVIVGRGGGAEGVLRISGAVPSTAARLAQYAADAVLLSTHAQRCVADFFETEAVPFEAGVETSAWKVLAPTGFRTRFEAAAQRGYTPLTGRNRDLARLRESLGRAVSGAGQMVSVVGEAGVGKSRLVHEFASGIDRTRVTVLEGRCQSHGTVTPYLPFLDAMRRALRLEEGESRNSMLTKVAEGVRKLDAALDEYLPFYLHLLSIPDERFPLPAGLEGEALKRALEQALVAAFTQGSRGRPIVIVLEDWHWADEASDSALARLLGAVASHSLLVIVVYRQEYRPAWEHVSSHVPLPLSNLEESGTEAIVRHSWDATGFIPPGLCRMIHQRSAGNPFFTEELCSALREDGSVSVSEHQAVLLHPLESVALPDSVTAAVQGRVDRLSQESRDALKIAAVIGREFDYAVLERVYGHGSSLARHLEQWLALELVLQTRVLPTMQYMFKHVLTQVGVYETLLKPRRAELHAAVARTIESLYGARIEDHHEILAHHFALSADVDKAAEYLEKAGDKSAALFSVRDALAYYRKSLDIFDGTQLDEARMRKAIEVSVKIMRVGWTQPSREFFRYLERSIEFAKRLGAERVLAELTFCVGRLHWMLGSFNDGIETLRRSVGFAESTGQFVLVATICTDLSNAYCHRADFDHALEYGERGYATGDTPLEHFLRGINRVFRSWAWASIGEFARSEEAMSEAKRIADELDSTFLHAWSNWWTGVNNNVRGQWDAATAGYVRSLPYYESMGERFGAGLAEAGHAFAACMNGDRSEGALSLLRGNQTLRELGTSCGFAETLPWEAEVWLLHGRLDRCANVLADALAIREQGHLYGEGRVLTIEAILGALNGALATETATAMERVFRLLRERKQRPDAAWARFRYAEVLHLQGDRYRACRELAEAVTLFQTLEMGWWCAQAHALQQRIDRNEPLAWFAPYSDQAT